MFHVEHCAAPAAQAAGSDHNSRCSTWNIDQNPSPRLRIALFFEKCSTWNIDQVQETSGISSTGQQRAGSYGKVAQPICNTAGRSAQIHKRERQHARLGRGSRGSAVAFIHTGAPRERRLFVTVQ